MQLIGSRFSNSFFLKVHCLSVVKILILILIEQNWKYCIAVQVTRVDNFLILIRNKNIHLIWKEESEIRNNNKTPILHMRSACYYNYCLKSQEINKIISKWSKLSLINLFASTYFFNSKFSIASSCEASGYSVWCWWEDAKAAVISDDEVFVVVVISLLIQH